MDKRHDTVLETLMEQLIEGGAENMGLVFARVFDLAMQIERERFLGAQHYERSPSRQGYTNGYKAKRIDTPAGTVCKFARNNDPLRGDFASNSNPS